jgi:hypothetical protein
VNGSSVCTHDQNLHLRSIFEYLYGYLFDVGCWNVSDLVRFYASGLLSNRIKGDDQKYELSDAVESFHIVAVLTPEIKTSVVILSVSVSVLRKKKLQHIDLHRNYIRKTSFTQNP